MIIVKAFYYIDRRRTTLSCNLQSFVEMGDADNAAWLCATLPGCISAQVVDCKLLPCGLTDETVLRVYARGDSGCVEDFTDLAESIRQLREAGSEFAEG